MLKRLVATLCGLELALVLGASAALALPSEAEDAALPGTFAGTVPLSSIEGESEGDGYASGDVALAIGRALCDRLGIEI